MMTEQELNERCANTHIMHYRYVFLNGRMLENWHVRNLYHGVEVRYPFGPSDVAELVAFDDALPDLTLHSANSDMTKAAELCAFSKFLDELSTTGNIYVEQMDSSYVVTIGIVATTDVPEAELFKRAVKAAASTVRKEIRKLVAQCKRKIRVMRKGDSVSKYRRS